MNLGDSAQFKDGMYILSDGTLVSESDMIGACQSLDDTRVFEKEVKYGNMQRSCSDDLSRIDECPKKLSNIANELEAYLHIGRADIADQIIIPKLRQLSKGDF